ncbi:PadR family transcriptional regulator [Demequina capsici]|uniref:PadR family transcriptional regulator n=1 Tax=Demequina capsici TaxID=3075620 RepID=A0AA96FD93_9MICO|nr:MULTISPECIES: PadR family transcriptional regulator [unclassified Demequina]WNM24462.1 PadR family transcriptional regulator [Demequina sp. OYTSA14]WNM27292.1 PadR family transcriptional regulator [Demequina sp. PMTSA13]
MAKTDVLTLGILGMLAEQPLHGYQIRKRLGSQLGPFRALSYGSLYPALKRMLESGLIENVGEDDAVATGSRRSRIAYALTTQGRARFEDELASAGAHAYDDDSFDLRFSLFGQTDSATRLRILEGRRMRLSERLEELQEMRRRQRERADAYTSELHRHGLERVEREVEWLDQLIENERSATRGEENGSAASAGDD